MTLCTEADVYSFGVPRGSLPNPGRLVASVSVAGNYLTLDAHGLGEGLALEFRAEAGGSLPAPLAEGVTYYARPLAAGRFAVSASPGGAALDLTTTGANVVVVVPLSAQIADAITWAEGIIYEHLPAHATPVADPVPTVLRTTCATLAAGRLLALRGAASKSIAELVAEAQTLVRRWASGVPVRQASAAGRTNLASAAAASAPYTDTRGWRQYGGL
jgi:hypothetical protein